MQDEAVHLRYLDTSEAAVHLIGFYPSERLTAGSIQKAGQAIRLVKSTFRDEVKCIVKVVASGIVIECPDVPESVLLDLCAVAEQKLERLRIEPLTAKMVEEILSVSGAELRRWSKDGRVPTSGRAYFSQGKKQVGLFLYPPEAIRELSSRPDQVAQWRNADRTNRH